MTIKKMSKKFFLGTKRKEFAAFMISHMYNSANKSTDKKAYFFAQKLGFWTLFRLTVAFVTFSHAIDSGIQARVFREIVTEPEYKQLKLHIIYAMRHRKQD